MGGVYRLAASGRTAVLKRPPPPESPWHGIFQASHLMEREVQTYRFLARLDGVSIAPRCLWSSLDPDGDAALVLEDIPQSIPAMAQFESGLSLDQALACMRTLAWLHARSQIAAREGATFSWAYAAESDDLVEAIRTGLAFALDIVGHALEPLLTTDIRSVVAEAHPAAGPRALCHGDCWSGNVLFRPAPGEPEPIAAVLIDWQFAMWGNPLTDVALLLISSLDVEARRLWIPSLLDAYRATFNAYSTWPISREECGAWLAQASPFAALVAVSMLDAYTFGLTPAGIAKVAARLASALEDMSGHFEIGTA